MEKNYNFIPRNFFSIVLCIAAIVGGTASIIAQYSKEVIFLSITKGSVIIGGIAAIFVGIIWVKNSMK